MRNIYVICPGNIVTGGPELLHQFVHRLNERGVKSSIIYYPFNQKFDVPLAYKSYNINVEVYNNVEKDSIVIIPEVTTGYSRFFKDSKIFIWWLSVDNYFNSKKPLSIIMDKLKGKYSGEDPGRVKLNKMSNFSHLTQSEYARLFLKDLGYESEMLSDYLNKDHFSKEFNVKDKGNIICFNPKKGSGITKKLIELNPELKFVPIENMTSKEVASLLNSAKVYIDFGQHPGKDRIPREAAMAGCIIITGMQGSAKNNIDMAIPKKYKHDERGIDFFNDVSVILNKSLVEYEVAINDFSSYRASIEKEESRFNNEIDLFVKNQKML